jgi:hypothetical protein
MSPEVTNISQHGFWILLEERELFVPFNEFPWFRNATIDSILKVEMPPLRTDFEQRFITLIHGGWYPDTLSDWTVFARIIDTRKK